MSLIPFNLDFSCFLSGLAAIALCAVAWRIGLRGVPANVERLIDRQQQALDWRWLAMAGAGLGFSEWLSLFSLKTNGAPAIWILGLLIQSVAWCSLLEFGRRGFRTTEPDARPRLPVWVHAPLFVLAMLGAIDGIEGLHLGVALALGLPAAGLTGLALLQASTLSERTVRPWGLHLLSGGLLLFALANAFGAYPICALTMVACACGAWLTCHQNTANESRSKMVQRYLAPAAFVLLAVGGWAVLRGDGATETIQPQLYLAQATSGAGKSASSVKLAKLDKPVSAAQLITESAASTRWRQSIPVLVIVLMVLGFWGLSRLPCVH